MGVDEQGQGNVERPKLGILEDLFSKGLGIGGCYKYHLHCEVTKLVIKEEMETYNLIRVSGT